MSDNITASEAKSYFQRFTLTDDQERWTAPEEVILGFCHYEGDQIANFLNIVEKVATRRMLELARADPSKFIIQGFAYQKALRDEHEVVDKYLQNIGPIAQDEIWRKAMHDAMPQLSEDVEGDEKEN